jgi:DNA-binding beta-propeller fold protein YncE
MTTKSTAIISSFTLALALLFAAQPLAAQMVYATDGGTNSLWVIDSSVSPPALVKTIPLPGTPGPLVVTPDGKYAYIAEGCVSGNESVSVVDLVNNAVAGSPIIVKRLIDGKPISNFTASLVVTQ